MDALLNLNLWIDTVIKLALAVIVGSFIGSERARHGRAAGMRTHILVCLGAAMTAMASLFVAKTLGVSGDVFRISAQVISGVGFLGAGMIVLKNNNTITGLTTAASVWTTGAIGVAIGYGFYPGVIVATALYMVVIVFFAKFENKKAISVVYVEIEDMSRVNELIPKLGAILPSKCSVIAAKSGIAGHIGLQILVEDKVEIDLAPLCAVDGVVFAVTE